MDDYQNVKKGCQTNNPTSHCQNCSYKELVPILNYVVVMDYSIYIENETQEIKDLINKIFNHPLITG